MVNIGMNTNNCGDVKLIIFIFWYLLLVIVSHTRHRIHFEKATAADTQPTTVSIADSNEISNEEIELPLRRQSSMFLGHREILQRERSRSLPDIYDLQNQHSVSEYSTDEEGYDVDRDDLRAVIEAAEASLNRMEEQVQENLYAETSDDKGSAGNIETQDEGVDEVTAGGDAERGENARSKERRSSGLVPLSVSIE